MATDIATIANRGPFKANKRDPEKMLSNINLYVESFANMLTVTDNAVAAREKKKALLKAVGGTDMIFMFKHIGKAGDDSTYDVAIATIHGIITGQTNQAMVQYKPFKDMA